MSDSHVTTVRYFSMKERDSKSVDVEVEFKYGKYFLAPDQEGDYVQVCELQATELINCGYHVVMTDCCNFFAYVPQDSDIDAALDWADYIADF